MYSVFELIDDFLPAILQFYQGGISLTNINTIGYTDAIKILDYYLDIKDFRITHKELYV